MGGYGSGRPAMTGVIEHRQRLDVRAFHRRRRLGTPGHRGVWSWECGGERSGSIGYTVLADALELDYVATDDDGEKHSIRYWIGLDRVPCRYGGHRFYWTCPWCRRRCEVLAIARGGFEWACRRCLRLQYQSQRLAPADRLQRRADGHYARAGIEGDDGLIYKHKWMRWRTFNRLVDQANDLAGAADAGFALRIMRLFGKTRGDLYKDLT
jgi:hypothetical protein